MKRQKIIISLLLCAIFLQIFVDCKQNAKKDLVSTLKQYLKEVRQENTFSEQIQQEQFSQQNIINSNSLYSLPSNQVESLTDLFSATNGYQWNTSTNWLYGDPCYNLWYGVYCNYPYNNTVLSLFVFKYFFLFSFYTFLFIFYLILILLILKIYFKLLNQIISLI